MYLMEMVVLDGYTENPGDLSWAGFEALGSLRVYDRTDQKDVAEIVRRIGTAEAVITNKTPIFLEIFELCPSIRYVGILATGYNVVDVAEAAKRGVTVTNIPDYGTAAVAQFAVALLLEACHHVGSHDMAVHRGRWTDAGDFCFWDYPLIELAGKTMGIIGFGRIGRATAKIAAALGMRVLAHDTQRAPEGEQLADYVELDRLLAESDVISLHCPLFAGTAGMINKNTIARMKDGVMLINTARGGLVVEQDLADALASGKVAAAGLDVVTEEPISRDNPLLSAPNCILTPHIAWASKESRQRLMDVAVANLRAFLTGAPQNVVSG